MGDAAFFITSWREMVLIIRQNCHFFQLLANNE